ncbi:MAG: phage tail sheath subtilisin-like domain-containing protein, partial [Nitrosomonas sp.]|nr:phage tail sheath subtilisin-like domain-containing protein [Nitrosomonas sp.]
MPEYLAPGVFVEEVSFRAKSIEGVGTSVAAVVGPTRYGPTRGNPEVVTSFGEFTRIYGDIRNLTLSGTSVLNHTAIAAKAFFDGGGKQLYVSRVVNYPSNGNGIASVSIDNDRLHFDSRFPGTMGNFTLELFWRDSENLLRTETVSEPAEGEVVFLNATGLTNAVRAENIQGRFPDARFPLDVSALVRRDGDRYVIVNNRCELTTADAVAAEGTELRVDGQPEGSEGILMAAGLVASENITVQFTRSHVRDPRDGDFAEGATAVLTFSGEVNLTNYTGAAHWGALTSLRGTLGVDNNEFIVYGSGLNSGVNEDIVIPVVALASVSNGIRSSIVQRNFDIAVHPGVADDSDDVDDSVIYNYSNISTAPGTGNSLSAVLAVTPDKRYDQLTSPVSCTVENGVTGERILQYLDELFDADALDPGEFSVLGPRYLISLSGGGDGSHPEATDYGGVENEVNGSSGFIALENIEDISIVMTPAAAADAANHQAIVTEVQKHCLKMRYRVGIVDSREGMALSEARQFGSNFDDSRLALYYPWVVIADPRGKTSTINVPPSGFIAGVYANTDVQRGVHKPPANEPVIGALRFAQDINRFQQELLNPNGV